VGTELAQVQGGTLFGHIDKKKSPVINGQVLKKVKYKSTTRKTKNGMEKDALQHRVGEGKGGALKTAPAWWVDSNKGHS